MESARHRLRREEPVATSSRRPLARGALEGEARPKPGGPPRQRLLAPVPSRSWLLGEERRAVRKAQGCRIAEEVIRRLGGGLDNAFARRAGGSLNVLFGGAGMLVPDSRILVPGVAYVKTPEAREQKFALILSPFSAVFGFWFSGSQP